jgi:hypothetical protein
MGYKGVGRRGVKLANSPLPAGVARLTVKVPGPGFFLRITKYLFFHQNSKVSLKRCVIVAKGTEGLREVMYKVITRMIEDGELVPVYEGDELVDIIVKVPVDTNT